MLPILHGLQEQVGTMYPDHGPGRDSSQRVKVIGPGDKCDLTHQAATFQDLT